MNSSPQLSIRGVEKSFGERKILSGIDVDIMKGEIVAINGTSGCGKTTLLRILGMLEDYDKGEIVFEGSKHTQKSEENKLMQRRKIGIVFQKPVPLNTSAYNNIAFGLKIRGMKKEEIEQKVHTMFRLLKMRKEDMHKNPLTFSGGEIQRLALARATIIEPELLLLDEPTANLDSENTEKFEQLLRQLNTKKNMSIIFSTHDKEQAKRMTDKIYHIKEGKLVKV